MKWKREIAGVYTSGSYKIKGKGLSWTLYEGRNKLDTGTSKKAMQHAADAHAGGVGTVKDYSAIQAGEPTERNKPVRKNTYTEGKDLEGVLASLSLQIDHLSHRIDSLNAESTKATKGLTDAVLLLGRHAAKLGGKR